MKDWQFEILYLLLKALLMMELMPNVHNRKTTAMLAEAQQIYENNKP